MLIFIIDMILKLILYKKKYFHRAWNCIDAFLNFLSIIGIIIEFTNPNLTKYDGLKYFCKFIDVIRVLRIINISKKITKTLSTLTYVLPTTWPLFILLFLVLYVFTIIGINIFPYIK